MKSYVFVFSQMLKEFRRAEFEAVAQMFKISVDIASVVTSRHACIVQLPSDECVRQILSRCMLVRSATELLASGSSYAELHEDLKRNADSFKKYNSPDQSFAFKLKPIGHKRDQKYIVDRFKELDFLPLHDSPVNLSSPTNRFNLIEESDGRKPNDPPFAVHFGRFIGNGQGELKNRYNLPDRCYIGNTTMDPELSFLMANLAQAQPNSLVLDPFCGTGGILLPAAHFGGYCIGSEINYMVAHGIGKSSRVDQKYLTDEETVRKNFEQYGLEKNFLALLVADSSRHDIWQFPSSSGLFDCIVADPPYGVREKGRKVGLKDRKPHWTLPSETECVQHYPQKTKYELTDVFLDLLNLAASTLVIGGRLAYWFPVFPEEYSDDVIPQHPALSLVANCEQMLNSHYGRRLMVLEKTRNSVEGEQAFVLRDCYEELSFRDRVFPTNNQ